jgi:hypothetical protein
MFLVMCAQREGLKMATKKVAKVKFANKAKAKKKVDDGPRFPERDRAVHELLQALKSMSAKEIAEKASYGRGFGKVSMGTIYKLRRVDGTRYPRHMTMVAMARATGMEYKLLKVNAPSQD